MTPFLSRFTANITLSAFLFTLFFAYPSGRLWAADIDYSAGFATPVNEPDAKAALTQIAQKITAAQMDYTDTAAKRLKNEMVIKGLEQLRDQLIDGQAKQKAGKVVVAALNIISLTLLVTGVGSAATLLLKEGVKAALKWAAIQIIVDPASATGYVLNRADNARMDEIAERIRTDAETALSSIASEVDAAGKTVDGTVDYNAALAVLRPKIVNQLVEADENRRLEKQKADSLANLQNNLLPRYGAAYVQRKTENDNNIEKTRLLLKSNEDKAKAGEEAAKNKAETDAIIKSAIADIGGIEFSGELAEIQAAADAVRANSLSYLIARARINGANAKAAAKIGKLYWAVCPQGMAAADFDALKTAVYKRHTDFRKAVQDIENALYEDARKAGEELGALKKKARDSYYVISQKLRDYASEQAKAAPVLDAPVPFPVPTENNTKYYGLADSDLNTPQKLLLALNDALKKVPSARAKMQAYLDYFENADVSYAGTHAELIVAHNRDAEEAVKYVREHLCLLLMGGDGNDAFALFDISTYDYQSIGGKSVGTKVNLGVIPVAAVQNYWNEKITWMRDSLLDIDIKEARLKNDIVRVEEGSSELDLFAAKERLWEKEFSEAVKVGDDIRKSLAGFVAYAKAKDPETGGQLQGWQISKPPEDTYGWNVTLSEIETRFAKCETDAAFFREKLGKSKDNANGLYLEAAERKKTYMEYGSLSEGFRRKMNAISERIEAVNTALKTADDPKGKVLFSMPEAQAILKERREKENKAFSIFSDIIGKGDILPGKEGDDYWWADFNVMLQKRWQPRPELAALYQKVESLRNKNQVKAYRTVLPIETLTIGGKTVSDPGRAYITLSPEDILDSKVAMLGVISKEAADDITAMMVSDDNGGKFTRIAVSGGRFSYEFTVRADVTSLLSFMPVFTDGKTGPRFGEVYVSYNEKDRSEEVKAFYQEFARAYESRSASAVMAFVAGSWTAGDGTALSDLEENLTNNFRLYDEIRYSLAGLKIESGSGKYQACYDVTITSRIFKRNLKHEEKSKVCEELSGEAGGKLKISKTFSGSYWYIK